MRVPVWARAWIALAVPAVLCGGLVGAFGAALVESGHHRSAAERLEAELRLAASRLPEPTDAQALAGVARDTGLQLWLVRDDEHMLGTPTTGRVVEAIEGTSAQIVLGERSARRLLRASVPTPPRSGWSALHGSTPTPQFADARAAWWRATALGTLLTLALLFPCAVWIGRRLRAPVEILTPVVDAVQGVDDPTAAAVAARDHVLALRERLADLAARHGQLQSVLASMVEGVIVVGADDAVAYLNPAAERLLHVGADRAKGRPLTELVRSLDLQKMVAEADAASGPVEREIVLRGEEDRSLQAHCSPVRGPGRTAIGTVLVLNDVTRLRRLERVRRDFVANVSHEIRTPITTIAGFVETLLDGALRDPEEAERFLRIVKRHADRLNAIVEDLLVLARVEQEDERALVRLERSRLAEVLQAAIDACRFKADEKGVTLRLAVAADLDAAVNGPLLEQAVVNLIDNAVKYSATGSGVDVSATPTDDGVRIDVEDHGAGISPEDLPRLFERFYRVDRARSRKLGGTGLGLAIVKHIAQVHGGRASVESEPGVGSTFTIHLPAAPSAAPVPVAD